MESEEEYLLLALLLRRRRKRHRRRTLWMHPITSERISVGQYYTLMHRLQADPAKFFDYFRMSEETFKNLLNLIQPYIARQDTNMRKSISAEERLAITLR